MKKITTIALSVALAMGVASCSQHTATEDKSVTQQLTKTSGIDLNNFDKSVRVEDDLYLGVNGNWLKNQVIPADKSNYGAFTKLRDDSQKALKTIIEDAAKTQATEGSNAQKIGDFYNSYMDVESINAKGIKPLMKQLDMIDNAEDHGDIIRLMAQLQQVGVGAPFGYYVYADAKNSDYNAMYLYQSGLTLPDRDYYIKDTEKFSTIRSKYQDYIGALLSKAGYSNADNAAKNIMTLETD